MNVPSLLTKKDYQELADMLYKFGAVPTQVYFPKQEIIIDLEDKECPTTTAK